MDQEAAISTRDEGIHVVGAGLVGPVAALYLARRGERVVLHERRPRPGSTGSNSREEGRSVHLVVSARGFRALRGVGLEAAVRAAAIPLHGRAIHTAGGTVRFQPYGSPGQAIYAVQRAALNRILVEAAARHPGITACFDRRCVDVDLDAGVLHFEDGTTGEHRTVEARRILAADGTFSRIRAAMMKRDLFDYSQQYMPYGYKELRIPVRGDGEPALASGALGAMHVWPRKRLMVSAFPNPDGSFTAMLVMPFAGETSFASFASIATERDLRDLFAREFPDVVPLLPEIPADFFTRRPSSLVTIRCSPWTFADRVALVGDAAHAMVPFFGQGMNAGLEDCVVLDACLAHHDGDWSWALPEYQALRKPNCDAVTDMSLANFVELCERVGDPRFLLQKEIEQKIHQMYPERFVPLYSMVAFGHLPYAEVQEVARAQDEVVRRILATERIEERWGTPEAEALVEEALRAAPLPLDPERVRAHAAV